MNYQVKGTALTATKDFFDSLMHEGYFNAEAKKIGLIKNGLLLASSWYDATKAFELFKAAGEDLDTDPMQLTKEAVRFGTQKDLNSIYRFFMKMGGAERVLSKAPQMANTYANYYKYNMLRNDPGIHEFTLSDVPQELSHWTLHIVEGALSGVLATCGKEIKDFRVISSDTYKADGKKFQNTLVKLSY